MNKILIPTDFSAAAENAMHYGAQLAQKLNASIVLLHVYQMPISMNEIPVMTLPVEDLRNSAEAGIKRCAEDLKTKYPELNITTECRMGLPEDEINDLAKETNPVAIVIGSHETSGLERLLFGSTAFSLVRDTKFPVIAVPSTFNTFHISTIVLATDLKNLSTMPYSKISEIVSMLHAELHIVHVQTEKEEQKTSLKELEHLSPIYFIIQNEDVKEGLLRYVDDVKADMLMILPHEHNLIERLFFKLHTEAIISDAKIPVLCLPA